jgi:hypothetical protein
MAEGCNLHLTLSDVNKIEAARNIGERVDAKNISRELLKCSLKNNVQEFRRVLNDKNHLAYKTVKELLIKALGEGKITKEEEDKLPDALHLILKDHPNPQGLFEAPPVHRGPGSDPMSHPYELLCAAALIQREVPTSLGNSLKIYSEDRIDFGEKFASHYALSTKKKGTGESDILIYRKEEKKEIGIDAKYTKGSIYDVKLDLPRQLNAIKSAFSDKQLDEFYFITNVQFDSDFKKMVDNTNAKIIRDWAEHNNQIYKDFKDITTDKKEIADASEIIRNLDFHNHRKEINELTEKYDIPQIGICERVNFEG